MVRIPNGIFRMVAPVCCGISCLTLAGAQAQSNTWYVDRSAVGAHNGSSWADAWTNTTAVAWELIEAGDTIYLSGGSTGATYAAFSTGRSGAPGHPIQIRRSQVLGHNGVVTLQAPVEIDHDQVVLDGADDRGIRLRCDVTTGLGALKIRGSEVMVRHVEFDGHYAASLGHSVSFIGTNLTIDRCYFSRTAFEDFGFWDGQGTLVIRDSYFTMPTPPPDGRHRDGWNPYTGGGYDILVERCIFTDLYSFVFLMQDPGPVGSLTFNHCVFDDLIMAVRFGSGNGGHGPVQFNHCTFHDCQATDFSDQVTMRNCIFSGVGPFDPEVVHTGSEVLEACLFEAGVGVVQDGVGNVVEGHPHYLNPHDPLGPDGIPFSADDGFNLLRGSYAIDAGIPIPGLTQDIRGQPYVGIPDIGAYEFFGSQLTNAPAAPQNPQVIPGGS